MSVFARADVAGVSVSPEHGGCGQFHSRPVVQGAPVALWQLTCPQCEDHLRSDPLWSANATKIPETPDEVAQHEDWKRRSERDTQFLLALALAKMAGEDVPESMRRALGGKSNAINGTVLCPNGHEQQAGTRFCPECGAGMSGAAALPPAGQQPSQPATGQGPEAGAGEADEDPSGADGFKTWQAPADQASPDAELESGGERLDLDSMTLGELKKVAVARGVQTARSKADQITALREAGL
jgi:hypothetical protein